MKYYIKATNTETGKSMIMSTPVFTNKKKAEAFAEDFARSLRRDVAKLEIITSRRPKHDN